jgi:hypothetical protein
MSVVLPIAHPIFGAPQSAHIPHAQAVAVNSHLLRNLGDAVPCDSRGENIACFRIQRRYEFPKPNAILQAFHRREASLLSIRQALERSAAYSLYTALA